MLLSSSLAWFFPHWMSSREQQTKALCHAAAGLRNYSPAHAQDSSSCSLLQKGMHFPALHLPRSKHTVSSSASPGGGHSLLFPGGKHQLKLSPGYNSCHTRLLIRTRTLQTARPQGLLSPEGHLTLVSTCSYATGHPEKHGSIPVQYDTPLQVALIASWHFFWAVSN